MARGTFFELRCPKTMGRRIVPALLVAGLLFLLAQLHSPVFVPCSDDDPNVAFDCVGMDLLQAISAYPAGFGGCAIIFGGIWAAYLRYRPETEPISLF
jgi:hypothetical protein